MDDPRQSAPAALVLPGEVESVARARSFIVEALERWRASPATSDDARLMVSEVVTNAVMYSEGDVELCVRRRGATARVEVRDESSATAIAGTLGDPKASRGWGLALVQALAQGWGIEQIEGDGKVVWFELPLDHTG
jgi:anti-sigma regulatory factor (Ser/Thr protein kinase)